LSSSLRRRIDGNTTTYSPGGRSSNVYVPSAAVVVDRSNGCVGGCSVGAARIQISSPSAGRRVRVFVTVPLSRPVAVRDSLALFDGVDGGDAGCDDGEHAGATNAAPAKIAARDSRLLAIAVRACAGASEAPQNGHAASSRQ
jgi:hypothetical protein